MFHWKDNLYFGRKEDGSVRILKFVNPPANWPDVNGDYKLTSAPAYGYDPRILVDIDITIPAAEWASITSSVSKSGEPQNYQRAVDLHVA